MAAKTFVKRCADEALDTATTGPTARITLEQAGAVTSIDKKSMRAADLIEQAAKLTWAKAHVKDAAEFDGLHVDEQASLARLFSVGKGKE